MVATAIGKQIWVPVESWATQQQLRDVVCWGKNLRWSSNWCCSFMLICWNPCFGYKAAAIWFTQISQQSVEQLVHDVGGHTILNIHFSIVLQNIFQWCGSAFWGTWVDIEKVILMDLTDCFAFTCIYIPFYFSSNLLRWFIDSARLLQEESSKLLLRWSLKLIILRAGSSQ